MQNVKRKIKEKPRGDYNNCKLQIASGKWQMANFGTIRVDYIAFTKSK